MDVENRSHISSWTYFLSLIFVVLKLGNMDAGSTLTPSVSFLNKNVYC